MRLLSALKNPARRTAVREFSTNKKGAKSENSAPRNIRLETDHGLFGFELPEVAATMPPMMAITARTATMVPLPLR